MIRPRLRPRPCSCQVKFGEDNPENVRYAAAGGGGGGGGGEKPQSAE
jgi:hypothetical protein